MQTAFGFLSTDIDRWQTKLSPLLSGASPLTVRRPLAQLIKSMISGRTRDAVSLAAFDRLKARYPTPGALAGASPAAVEDIIADVTFAQDKARYVVAALQRLRAERRFALEWLMHRPIAEALAWLERFDGVGRKVSASTLNASTLALPVMIVDTHVLRVLRRLGAVPETADYRAASEAVTPAMPQWSGPDFLAFHVATKRLGQLICRPEAPLCTICPLVEDCPTARRCMVSQGPIAG